MRALKRFFIIYIVLIYALLTIYRSVAYSGFPAPVFNFKEKILNAYLLYENNKSFALVGDISQQYLKSYEEMMKSYVSEYSWYDKLKNEGVLKGAYVRSGITSFTVGSPFIPQFNTEVQYYIDDDGFIHYSYSNATRDVFLDTIIDFTHFSSTIEGLTRIPRWIVFYDQFRDTHSIVFNQNNEQRIDFNADEIIGAQSPLVKGFKGVLYAKSLTLAHANLVLIASYPLKLGERAVLLIGLIVLLLLTILLVFFTICFIFSNLKLLKKRKVILVQQERRRNVVSEIDGALFAVKDAVSGLTTSKQEEVVEKPKKGLAYDGIHIKKT